MKLINLISLSASIYLTLTRTLGICQDLTFQVNGDSVIRGSTLCTGIIGVVSLIKFGQNLIIDLNLQDSFPIILIKTPMVVVCMVVCIISSI